MLKVMYLPFLQSYSRIEDHDVEDEFKQEKSSHHNAQRQKLKQCLLILQVEVAVLVLVCLFLALQIRSKDSAMLVPLTGGDLLLAPAGQVQQIWQYQKIYSQEPNDESEAAWRDIFPKGRGFVHHEELAPNISNVAVFHELHCLHGIRTAYYHAISDKPTNAASAADDAQLDTTKHIRHVRHCFDYLRQALMCNADSNLEEVDWKLGGATGWGVKRQCRDYDAVVKWTERYRLHSQTNIS